MKSSVLQPSLLLGFEIGSRRVKYLHLLSRDIDIFNVIDCHILAQVVHRGSAFHTLLLLNVQKPFRPVRESLLFLFILSQQ